MTDPLDRLYDLLPYVYRQRDEAQNGSLRALLQVVAEQVNVVEADIAQLYDNWFIETCQDWVVPYIGDLLGYTPVHEAGEPGDVRTPRERQLNKILISRRDVANTIGYRRRKGTLALLEILANAVAHWPARAVEFYTLLGVAQSINHLRLERGRTIDVRSGDALDRLDGPFDELAHTVDVRRINSRYDRGRYNIPSVGVFVWRLREYPVTQAPATCIDDTGGQCYTFSVLGNDVPLYARAFDEPDPTHIAEEDNLPVPIRRHAFEQDTDPKIKPESKRFYGAKKSLQIWVGQQTDAAITRQAIEADRIIAADLSDWFKYRIPQGKVAIDPVLGRIRFPISEQPDGVWVSYRYGFSADIGGGEYTRPILQPIDPAAPDGPASQFAVYRVGEKETLTTIEDALKAWTPEARSQQPHAVIEIVDSGVYTEQLNIMLNKGESLQIRAANRTRPTLYLLDRQKNRPDALTVINRSKEAGGCFSLDGLLITGRGIRIEGPLAEVNIRHCTLVPGWEIDHKCRPKKVKPSLELYRTNARCTIEHSLLGGIRVHHDNVMLEPLTLHLSDSILDATAEKRIALCDYDEAPAHTRLTIERCTVIGSVRSHTIELAEDTIFMSEVLAARRQIGCVRFCYVPPGSRTPRRFECQPDLAERALTQPASTSGRGVSSQALAAERARVRPQFNSLRYGTPTYGQLAAACAEEIKRGASDQSEMGVFHDLYQPQREANLRTRLEEYTPAGMHVGIIFAS